MVLPRLEAGQGSTVTRRYDNTDAEFKELERRRIAEEQERKRRELEEANKRKK